jgi:hypothetical protein
VPFVALGYGACVSRGVNVVVSCIGLALLLAGCTSDDDASAEASVCEAFDSLAAAVERYDSVVAVPDSVAADAWEQISEAGDPDDERFADFVSKIDYPGGNQLALAVSDAEMEYAEQTCQALGYDIVSPAAGTP